MRALRRLAAADSPGPLVGRALSRVLFVAVLVFAGAAAVADPRLAVSRSDWRISPEIVAVTPSRVSVGEPAAADLSGVDYLLWVGHGRAEWAVGMGTVGRFSAAPATVPAYGPSAASMALWRPHPTVSVGVRLHLSPASALYADASGARGLGADPQADFVRAKVGMEWHSASHRIGFDHGAFGVRFDSGYQLSLKPRHGGLALYLRSRF